jgi:hypothetical protein
LCMLLSNDIFQSLVINFAECSPIENKNMITRRNDLLTQ